MALAVERNLFASAAARTPAARAAAQRDSCRRSAHSELRQLVQPRAAEKPADRRDAVVVLLRPHRARAGLCVLAHRAELVDGEDRPCWPTRFCRYSTGPADVSSHCQRDDGHDWARQHETDERGARCRASRLLLRSSRLLRNPAEKINQLGRRFSTAIFPVSSS